jgi:hypothetical protein
MRSNLFFALLLLVFPCRSASVTQIQTTYEAILNSSSASAGPSQKDVASIVNETTIGQLSDEELKMILPVIGRCLDSPTPAIVQHGFAFLLLTTAVRPNSAFLLAPYISTLERFSSDEDSTFSKEALHIMLALRPKYRLRLFPI